MNTKLVFIGVMLAMGAAQVPTKPPSGPCEDLDTASCAGFHKANPALCNDPAFSNGMCKRFCGNCPIECYSCPHAVLQPHDCNTTVTCGPTMQCVSKHLRAADGHHEYYLMCETKEICDLFAYGFGKRDLPNTNDRMERDITINCCNTDRCNYYAHTTTEPVTTTLTPTRPSVKCYNYPFPLADPNDCNITYLCAPNEACMTKHLRAHDGHHEYIMTCEKKEVCSSLQFGFVGKRSPYEGFDDPDSETAGSRAERNIDIDCCETDLCNVPLMTTTTTLPPTTVTTTQPTVKTTIKTTTTAPNTTCHKDVVFMIDDSGSVGQTNFQHSKDFVSQLVSQMRFDPNGAQVSVMAFSSHPQIEWYLNTYHTQTELQNALQHKVNYVSGKSNTGNALDAVRTNILSSHKGDRRDAANVVVMLTDGTSDDHTYNEVLRLHTESHDVIAIGIGRYPSDTELRFIATDRQHAFHIASYTDLPRMAQHVLSLICK